MDSYLVIISTYAPNIILVYDWIDHNVRQHIPPNAVSCGNDCDGSPVYIGRANHQNVMLAVKIVPRRHEAYICYNGSEIRVSSYKVLINHRRESPVWQSCSDGFVPQNAIQCGYNKDGYKLFVGRAIHNGVQVPGYVHPRYKCIYYPFGGKELSSKQYEVLIHQIN